MNRVTNYTEKINESMYRVTNYKKTRKEKSN